MPNVVMVGTQWGDEGKGKIVDVLTARAEIVARFQGGANAGHTVVVGGRKTILHLIPSGILHPGKACVIGNGVVVDPETLVREIDEVKSQGAFQDDSQLLISENAHVIMPWHKLLDSYRERASGGKAIGTTHRGIGPAYEDKAARVGTRMRDLLRPAVLARRVLEELPGAEDELRGLAEQLNVKPPALLPAAITEDYARLGARLSIYVRDTSIYLAGALREGRKILFEGAQGTLLDVDHGTYPYVTSSNTVAGNAACGSGVGPTAIGSVMGVAKAYTTRVGAGPFPTELDDATGEWLRKAGSEYGATTGRPRRCGWLDALVLRYAARVNGLTSLAITKLDVLSGMKVIRIAVAYRLNGNLVHELPSDAEELAAVEPVYEDLPGWDEPLDGIRSAGELPATVQRFLGRIEELCGVPITCLSIGPDREQTMLLRDPFAG